ncbi:hypothetical protein GCM10007898_26890 [Dyella flagellata]|uniref:Adhesin n=1 Tax=Dyella flagellata TaxID=1867833 RepID=A0ABQ5XDQ4_9GAMM|nr:hypothetical protein GCM10007898_26890 [Dyella flagellata]
MIALTIVGAFGASQAYAQSTSGTQVTVTKNVALNSDISLSGDPDVDGHINLSAAAVALSNGTQASSNNADVNGSNVSNSANIAGNVGSGASGNVGVNQASGDFNAQGNQAAIAASSDAGFTFDCDHCKDHSGSMADAETIATQSSMSNLTLNAGTTNKANIGGNAFSNASGNVGVNQAVGNGNEQLNQLSAATAANVAYAVATSSLDQEWSGNGVGNDFGVLGCGYPQATSNTTNLAGNAFSGASGNIGLNQAAGTGNMQSNSLAMGVSNP